MTATEIYLNNAGAADKIKYNSTANVSEDKFADLGDKLQEFILTLQQSNISNNSTSTTTDTTANVKDAKYDAMTKRMMAMEKMMEKMMTQMAAKPNATITTTDNKKDGGRNRTFKFPRNMVGYCHSCGFHPVGTKHDSETCN